MTYDIEREIRKLNDIRQAFRAAFPLAEEEDLPSAPCHILDFLRDRVAKEVSEGVFHFQSRIVRVLCEVSPPKTHVEDMARIAVNQARKLPAATKLIEEQKALLIESRRRMDWLQARLRQLPEDVQLAIGLTVKPGPLTKAIDEAMAREKTDANGNS